MRNAWSSKRYQKVNPAPKLATIPVRHPGVQTFGRVVPHPSRYLVNADCHRPSPAPHLDQRPGAPKILVEQEPRARCLIANLNTYRVLRYFLKNRSVGASKIAPFCLQHRYGARPDWNDSSLLVPSRCVAIFDAVAS